MSREIKFRGKSIGTDEWIYGGFFTSVEEEALEHYVFDPINGGIIVKPKSVGQFTGLYDKNGVEIYEGDIVKGTDKHKGQSEVIYHIAWWEPFSFLDCYDYNKFEIIGNIHENPELLK